jgi:hypothetical protein
MMPEKNTGKKINQLYSFRAKKEAQKVIDLCYEGRYPLTDMINDCIAAQGKKWLLRKIKSAEDISSKVDSL